MSHLLARTFGLLAVVTSLVIGTAIPAVAYAPADSITVSSTTVDRGGSVQLGVQNGTFGSGERLTITVRGENASGVSFALVRAGVETATHTATANAAGGMNALTLTFPENASGAYTIAVFSASSPGANVTVTIGSLSVTGFDSQSLIGLWVGGGALILAGIVVLIASFVVRRRRKLDEA
ncbi:cell wall protein [Microbacterium sp. SORGH_AS_0888]|uniref:cell wall protein n=1 Tax=Microbacterium sp. SORGH_AS_0888 TaxID=3041791 RepID=UPI002786FC4D|nr:cell wall protein [Microbacterium sp. SORGH_AS_0888]MDQ1129336.1 hypothetical protein [Microbacterium sp. SORGH_AS_0888]